MKKLYVIFTAMLLVSVACNKPAVKPGEFVRPLADSTVLVEHAGGKITAKDVAQYIKPQIKQMNKQLFDAYKNTAEQMVLTKLLEKEAKEAGLPGIRELLSSKLQNLSVSDEELKAWKVSNAQYVKNYRDPRTGQKSKPNDAQLKELVRNNKMRSVQQAMIEGTLAKAKIVHKLVQPKTVVPLDDSPFKGGKNAKVVIHEFSDFECPACQAASLVVNQIAKEFGDKVKIVYRDFPLPMHKNAKAASVAALCAHEQQKFWPMHDLLFANYSSLGPAKYTELAKKVGLDMDKFAKCQQNPAMMQKVEADIAVGRSDAVGISATPTFFINGIRQEGSPGFAKLKAMVEAELAK